MAELDAMLRMLYGSPEADPDLVKIFAINGDGDEDALSFDEFAQVGGSLRVSNRAIYYMQYAVGIGFALLNRNFSLTGAGGSPQPLQLIQPLQLRSTIWRRATIGISHFAQSLYF